MNDKAAADLGRVLEALALRMVSIDAKLDKVLAAMEQQEKEKDAEALATVTANHGEKIARGLQFNRRALREMASKPATNTQDEFNHYLPGLPD